MTDLSEDLLFLESKDTASFANDLPLCVQPQGGVDVLSQADGHRGRKHTAAFPHASFLVGQKDRSKSKALRKSGFCKVVCYTVAV